MADENTELRVKNAMEKMVERRKKTLALWYMITRIKCDKSVEKFVDDEFEKMEATLDKENPFDINPLNQLKKKHRGDEIYNSG